MFVSSNVKKHLIITITFIQLFGKGHIEKRNNSDRTDSNDSRRSLQYNTVIYCTITMHYAVQYSYSIFSFLLFLKSTLSVHIFREGEVEKQNIYSSLTDWGASARPLTLSLSAVFRNAGNWS